MISYPASVALDLCLKINNRIIQEFSNIDTRLSAEEIKESRAVLNLLLYETNNPSFGKIYVSVYQFEDGNTLTFEIMARMGQFQTYMELEKIDVDKMMEQFQELNPVYSSGILRRLGLKGESRLVKENTFEARFRIFDDLFEADKDDSSFDFDEGEIVSLTIPYVRGMLDIDHMIRPAGIIS